MLSLERLSFGVGDRFAHQAAAQLRAFQMLAERGPHVTPVWNKSNREHVLIGSDPQSTRDAAQAAVKALGWNHGWHVDADHIRLDTVDRFLACSDFFTLDVADSIGQLAPTEAVDRFLKRHPELAGTITVTGLVRPEPDRGQSRDTIRIHLEEAEAARIAGRYLRAAQDAGKLFRHIAAQKGGEDRFIAEVSLDETESAQTPPELLIILAALADEGVRAQTIAPKFTGRFNKGVDYVGEVAQFEKEFNDDLAVVAHAVARYGLPANLKLSVHSGSDKFSLYPIIRDALERTGAGVHVKTAGTTWLEELTGLAEAGGDGLALAKEIYASAVSHVDELCRPYTSVLDLDRRKLPSPAEVAKWCGDQFARALRHSPGHPDFNPSFRQLLHVSFKLAAQTGERYLALLEANQTIVARNVTENLYQRHLLPLFVNPSRAR